jgi:hypothetical protein
MSKLTLSFRVLRHPPKSFRRINMRHHLAWFSALWLSACIPPHAPAQQVSEVARELNVATRFGKMDVAAESTTDAHRSNFLKRRADWGKEIRVVDVELAQLTLQTSEAAEVFVDVSWVRMDEGVLRSTRVKQHWANPGGGWKLAEEERVAGDLGLLGETVVVLRPDAPRDVHFPTKTLHGVD